MSMSACTSTAEAVVGPSQMNQAPLTSRSSAHARPNMSRLSNGVINYRLLVYKSVKK